MRIEKLKIYKFDELSKKAQSNAVENWRNKGCWNESDNELLQEEFIQELVNFGFCDDVKIEYSLSYSQGDGVAFYGDIDISNWLKNNFNNFNEKQMKILNTLSNNNFTIDVSTKRNSFGYMYSHQNTINLNIEIEYDPFYHGCYKCDFEENCTCDLEKLDGELEELEELIEHFLLKDIKGLSQKLEEIGYDMIDHSSKGSVITENFIENDYEFLEDREMFF